MMPGTPPLSVAPMMDRTDRHFRVLVRLISQHTLLYTEMVTTGALLRGDVERHLGFDPREHPIALQLGGDDPAALAACARLAEARGYDEVNLNVGCPSDRVQQGRFGACLMREPAQVAACVEAMRAATSLPVTVKHRIGVDELDAYDDMRRFVDVVAAAGCARFSVHARKAWLSGLSPRENRTVPPLRYADVYRLKAERPELAIEINGGITTLAEAEAHLALVDAVMIGRAAYDDPWLFAEADARVFGRPGPVRTRADVVRAMAAYAEGWLSGGGRLHHVTRHMLGLFAGVPGGRRFRQILGGATRPEAGPALLIQALEAVDGVAA
ncbi:MAG: tRNA dihydrouridine(20/20a) synthase DusA [bacterium]